MHVHVHAHVHVPVPVPVPVHVPVPVPVPVPARTPCMRACAYHGLCTAQWTSPNPNAHPSPKPKPKRKPNPNPNQVGTTAYELQEIYGIEGQPVDGLILTQALTLP